jgi:ribosome-associated protein
LTSKTKKTKKPVPFKGAGKARPKTASKAAFEKSGAVRAGAKAKAKATSRATSGTLRTSASARAAGTGGTAKASGNQKRRSASKAPFGPRSSGRVQTLAPGAAATSAAANPRRVRETADSLEAAIAAIDAALDKKALLPVLIDVSSLASYTDFIGIVSGRSDRQVDAIADGILTAMKQRGRSLLGQEGSGSGRWTLLDFGDVVIHVFYHPVREFYDLESLWVDAPRVQLRVPPEAVMAQPDALYGNL